MQAYFPRVPAVDKKIIIIQAVPGLRTSSVLMSVGTVVYGSSLVSVKCLT